MSHFTRYSLRLRLTRHEITPKQFCKFSYCCCSYIIANQNQRNIATLQQQLGKCLNNHEDAFQFNFIRCNKLGQIILRSVLLINFLVYMDLVTSQYQYIFYQTQFYQLPGIMHFLRHAMRSLNKTTFQNVYFRASQKAKKDLYEILGVSKSADPKQIKKAYYKLAQELHPDKNPSPEAKEKFTQINNAYQVLSDTSKKQMYDQTGHSGQGNAADYNNSHSGDPGFNPENIFSQFKGFKQNGQSSGGFEDIFKQFFGGGFDPRQAKNQRGDHQPSTLNLSISFQESVKGVNKMLQFQRRNTCTTCNGSRAKAGTQPQKCRTCDGSGMQSFKQGMYVMKTTCGACGGQGQKIKHFCGTCNGSGQQKKRVKQQLQIPRGIGDGMTIKMNNKGNFNSDLYIKVHVKKSNIFGRQGHNATSQLKLSVLDAILGGQYQIKTIQGTTKKIYIPSGTQPGQKIILNNEGFYVLNSSSKGNHIITVVISIPKQLTSQQRALFQQIKAINK